MTAAAFLAQLWKGSRLQRGTVILLLIVLTATGAAELSRSSNLGSYTYLATSAEETQLAEDVRNRTEPDAVFATAPVHNHWVTMWAARPIVMGYSTWVWNFGYDYVEREQDISRLYTQPLTRDVIIQKYKIDFLVIGPNEETAFGMVSVPDYPVFARSASTTVYDVRGLRTQDEQITVE